MAEMALEHFQSYSEAWLVYPKKATGKPRILYNDAVEEALCVGWIDSTVKGLDENHTMQRFTPRRKGSTFSQPNKERLNWLAAHDLLHPSVKEEINSVLAIPFHFPEDILASIHQDPEVLGHFEQFSKPYQRIRIAYIDAARKRPEEFQKRLANFLSKTKEGKMVRGFGGIDKYY